MRALFSISAFILLGLFSCKKDNPETPAPTILYDISGSVNLYDEGTTLLSNAGMTVTIEGSNPTVSAVTDADGKFRLPEVPSGTYTLSYEKTDYGTFKKFNVDHTQKTNTVITQSPSLGMKTTTSVILLNTNTSNDTVILTTTLQQNANNGNPKYVRVFLGRNADLSPQKYDAYSPTYVKQINPFTIKYSRAELIDMGFQQGEKVYVNVVGESFFANDYNDPALNKQVFPNILWTAGGDHFVIP